MTPRTAVLLGATGLIGGHCLELLLATNNYVRVITLGRRAVAREHPKLTQHEVDLAQPETYQDWLTPQSDFFSCLGTTIKKAGSESAFRRVDYEYPLAVARVAATHADNRWLLVSSLGADAASSLFYPKVKGELERDLAALPLAGVSIFRPSLLLGTRTEFRLGERVAEVVAWPVSRLLLGPLRKYRPIAALDVARAMLIVAREQAQSVQIYESDAIAALAA